MQYQVSHLQQASMTHDTTQARTNPSHRGSAIRISVSSHTSSQPSASGGLATPTCEGWCATVSLVPGVGVGVLVLVHAEERRAAVIGHEQLRPALARAQGVLRGDCTVLYCTVLYCTALYCTFLYSHLSSRSVVGGTKVVVVGMALQPTWKAPGHLPSSCVDIV